MANDLARFDYFAHTNEGKVQVHPDEVSITSGRRSIHGNIPARDIFH